MSIAGAVETYRNLNSNSWKLSHHLFALRWLQSLFGLKKWNTVVVVIDWHISIFPTTTTTENPIISRVPNDHKNKRFNRSESKSIHCSMQSKLLAIPSNRYTFLARAALLGSTWLMPPFVQSCQINPHWEFIYQVPPRPTFTIKCHHTA